MNVTIRFSWFKIKIYNKKAREIKEKMAGWQQEPDCPWQTHREQQRSVTDGIVL